MKPETNTLLPISQAAEWPQQAVREQKWSLAAQRWAIIRKAYAEHAIVWLQGAKAHVEANELEQAELLLNYSHQHYSNNVFTCIFTAELAIKRLQWDIAEKHLQQAREKFPHIVQTWIKSAECAECQGHIEKATQYYQQAMKCAPDNIQAFIEYAESAMRTEQLEEALERWKIVRRHFPKARIGYLRAAEAAKKLENNQLARQLLLAFEYGDEITNNVHAERPFTRPQRKKLSVGHLVEIIWTKAVFNLRSEAHRNYLSYAWLILEPLLHIMVFYIIFSTFLQRGGENFLVFLFAGQIPWMWFSKAVSGSSGSILAGKNLMLQIGLPSIIFPLINMLKISLQQTLVFIMLFGFIWLQGFSPNILWWYLIPIICVQLLVTTACTCIAAAIIPFARDLNYLVTTGLMFLMFGSGIFYNYKSLSVQWQELFLLNPIAFLINSYREILIYNNPPDLMALSTWGLVSFTACLLVGLIFSKLRYIYPRIVME